MTMAMTCKLCGSRSRLSSSPELKKANESLEWSNHVIRWRSTLAILWLLGFVTGGSICFLLRCDIGAFGSWGHEETPMSCESKAQSFLHYYNVSNSQLHALATSFSESDQIESLQCTREPESGMPLRNGVTCALIVPFSKKHELQKKSIWFAGDVQHEDQCPVQDVNVPSKLDLSVLMNISQTRTWNDYTRDPFRIIYFCLFEDCWWFICGMIVICIVTGVFLKSRSNHKHKHDLLQPVSQPPVSLQPNMPLQQKQTQQTPHPPRSAGNWRKKALVTFIICGIVASIILFWYMKDEMHSRRKETLASMCDERARMLQDQFNVSMNDVHALAILVSTFHHRKNPSAIDQKTFGEYTERTAFERPLTSGVAYALKVLHSEREEFEKQHGWTIKKMETEDQSPVQDCTPENLDPAPVQNEYAPVVFSQETVSHIVSIDMMSGKEDRENILRARASGKGVLTPPFKLLKSNHLGVVLTFAVYDTDLPQDATPEQRIKATLGYLGASYDVPSLVERLLHQLASKQTIVVNVYDTTNASAPINMYGPDVTDTGLVRVSNLDFGDPSRKHEMQCRFKQKPPLPISAILASMAVQVITLLLGHIFHEAIKRIAQVENDYHEVMELKARAEAADVAKSQFLATVSHEIRTPMNGVLGMLQMLMDTELDAAQLDYAQTAHNSGKDLISLINDVLDQAKIESGRLEPEFVPFHLHDVLDNVLSLFSSKSNEKGIELAIYVSDRVPEVVVGDPGRFRQIITNLVGNSIKFTQDTGHIFISVHLIDDIRSKVNVEDRVLQQSLKSVRNKSDKVCNTLSGFPVVDRWKSWENFKMFDSTNTMEELDMVKLLVTVEDTGVGIPREAQERIFTPFMQADSSTSRTYGGTGIGLSISRCLVELMGGEIGFVSEPGTGSTFSFTVTFTKGERSSLDPKWQQYVPDVSEFRGLRALVIDDRSIRAEVTRYHLQRLGMSVHMTTSMHSACSYLSDVCSNSVLPQLAMVLIDKDVWNKETGVVLHYMLKKQRREGSLEISRNLPKFFLLATSISETERDELKSDGIVTLLTKPLRLSVLIGCFQEDPESSKKLQQKRKKPSLGNLLQGRQILVVDDNMVNRRVAEGALKKHGAVVTCVDCGRAAVEKLKPPHKFDACFMDLQMPEMDGFEATRQIRLLENEINEQIASGEVSIEMLANVAHWRVPILAMTADVIQASNDRCVRCGMDDYVSKPFEDEQLYAAVARFFMSG